jgi:UrcA family protein
MNLKLGLALTAALLLPELTLADPPVETRIISAKSPVPSVVVHYGDLDLSVPADVHKLHSRLNSAAWQVCQPMLVRPVSVEGDQCRAQLVAAAVEDINQAHLTSAGGPILR